jgi:CheY-like chemotaxis protein
MARILIVDDDIDQCRLLCEQLEEMGYAADCLKSPGAFFDRLR